MNERFGQFIKDMRKRYHMTQKDLAEKLNISDKAVSKWEVGDSYPDISLLIPLSEAFNITVDELLSCKLNLQEQKNEITKKLTLFNIAANLILIITLLFFILISIIKTNESSSLVFGINDFEVYIQTTLTIVLILSIIFGSYNFLYYKKIGRGEKSEEFSN